MNIKYDKQSDLLTLTVCDAEVLKSKEVRFGLIVDYGANGAVVSYNIRNASEHIENLTQLEKHPQAVLTQAMNRIANAVSYNGAQPIP